MGSLYIKVRPLAVLFLFCIATSFFVWAPFIQQLSFLGIHIPGTNTELIYRHYDGLLYVVAAKSWYDPSIIAALPLDVPLDPSYFAAHLPLYPGLIRLLAMCGIDYVKAMMIVTVASSVVLAWVFYGFLGAFRITKHPVRLTMLMMMFPRLLVVRSIGAPEPLFMALIIGSLWMWEHKRFWIAGMLGAVATMAKLPGVLLIAAFGLSALQQLRTKRTIQWGWIGGLLPAVGLGAVCMLYAAQYGDFFAYWHTDYVVPMLYPFAAFNMQARWVGTGWLEDVLGYFALYIYAVVSMVRSHLRSVFYFALIFVLATTFVQHRDISRYLLPVWPFVVVHFERQLMSRKFFIFSLLILPAIYLYAWNFMMQNAMPVTRWDAFF